MSDNADAYEDDMGEKPPTVEAQCFFAMRADIVELINSTRRVDGRGDLESDPRFTDNKVE